MTAADRVRAKEEAALAAKQLRQRDRVIENERQEERRFVDPSTSFILPSPPSYSCLIVVLVQRWKAEERKAIKRMEMQQRQREHRDAQEAAEAKLKAEADAAAAAARAREAELALQKRSLFAQLTAAGKHNLSDHIYAILLIYVVMIIIAELKTKQGHDEWMKSNEEKQKQALAEREAKYRQRAEQRERRRAQKQGLMDRKQFIEFVDMEASDLAKLPKEEQRLVQLGNSTTFYKLPKHSVQSRRKIKKTNFRVVQVTSTCLIMITSLS
jgi:hypothetical protein